MRRLATLGLLVVLSLSLSAAVIWVASAKAAAAANHGPVTNHDAAASDHEALPTRAGRWECWDDGSLDPCHRDQYTIQALAEGDIWIGSGGNNSAGIRHFDGVAWRELTPARPEVTQHDLRDLDILSPTFGLAVGSNDSWRWNGQQWHTEEIDHDWIFMNLNAVDILAADDAWAAGSGLRQGVIYGSVAHWDGGQWAVYTATNKLNAVSIAAAGDAWVVGDSGAAYHWDGDVWTDRSWPVGRRLNGVAARPGGEAWAVGDSGSLIYYDGQAWFTETLTTTADLHDIVMTAAGEGWLVGDEGMAFHYDGAAWLARPIPADTLLKSVDVLPGGRVYALGLAGDLYTRAAGGAWTTVYEAPLRDWLFDVVMVGSDDGWVVGNHGRAQRWDGNTWSEVPIPFGTTLKGLDFLNAGDGWGVGNGGAIMHWDGIDWNTTPAVTSTVLSDVDLISPTLGFAIGFDGAILQFDGYEWQEFPSPTQLTLYALEMVSPDDGWAVGGGYSGHYVDVILRWDGQHWAHAVPEDSFGCLFTGVSVAGPDDIYFSCNSALYHYDGQSWHRDTGTGVGAPVSVDMISVEDGWVTSSQGVISHWDGQGWEKVFNPTANIDVVCAVSHDEAWAVTGSNSGGAILHYTAPSQQQAGLSPGMTLSQTYPGHATTVSPLNSGNAFTLTYKLRPYEQDNYLGLDHFFELDASTVPFTAKLTLTIENPEAYGILAPFVGLYRLEEGQWQNDDLTLLSQPADPRPVASAAGLALEMEYEVTKAGSYGLLMKTPSHHVYLPSLLRE